MNLWKGASSTSLVTLATMRIIASVLEANKLPAGSCRRSGDGSAPASRFSSLYEDDWKGSIEHARA